MTAEDVYRSVETFVNNHDFKLKNVFVHAWEADYFSVTSSKYCYETEVKVSRSDFFADLKKPKHELFKTCIDWSYKKGPNKFYYACPVGLIEEYEVPKYAGLIYVLDGGQFRIMRKAPFLHKDAFDHRVMLFDKYFYKYLNLLNENWDLKRKIKNLENQIHPITDK